MSKANLIKVCFNKKQALTNVYTNRSYSQKKSGFIGSVFDNLKDELSKNKEMNESIKKFREEAKKLEQSDALKEARKKYRSLEDDGSKSAQILKEKLGAFGEAVKESEVTRQAGQVLKQAGEAAKTIGKSASDLSNSEAAKKVAQNVKVIKTEIDTLTQTNRTKVYIAPVKLRKRTEYEVQRTVEANAEATGIEMHKDAKQANSWKNWINTSKIMDKLYEKKMQYDESENPVVRTTRIITDKLQDAFSGLFKRSEVAEVIDEICQIDPTFTIHEFTDFVQFDVIPNVLQSLAQKEYDILKDWCSETAYTQLTQPSIQAEQMKVKLNIKVLDVSQVEVASGKMMEQGPVFILSFVSQQLIYATDSSNKVIQGDPEKILRVNHIWVLARDMTVMDSRSAWRLIECIQQTSEVFI